MLPGGIGVPEMIIVGIIALLLFGKRLPEVAKGLGKSIVEFKKGISGIEDDVKSSGRNSYTSTTSRPSVDDDDDEMRMTAPKFEPPSSEPKEEATV